MERNLEAVSVLRRAHRVQTLRHPLGVAMLAALADLHAPGDRVGAVVMWLTREQPQRWGDRERARDIFAKSLSRRARLS
jgi:hypothetical protein